MESAPLASLVITMMALGAMVMTLIGMALVGRAIGGGRIAIAADGSILLWLSTAVSAYVLSLALSIATQRREPALEESSIGRDVRPGWDDLGDSLGLAEAGPGLLASDRDRLWTLERLEAAEGLGLLSPFGFNALSTKTFTRIRVEELYEILTDAVRYPDAQQVDRAISDAMAAMAEGCISEEELSPLLERLACEGSPEALSSAMTAYVYRPTGADRARAQCVLDEAFVRGQLSPLAFNDRSERLVRARTTSVITETLEGLRWREATRSTDALAGDTTYNFRDRAASWFWSGVTFAAALGPAIPATNASRVGCEARAPQSSVTRMSNGQTTVEMERDTPLKE
jgi:hypothetical protein